MKILPILEVIYLYIHWHETTIREVLLGLQWTNLSAYNSLNDQKAKGEDEHTRYYLEMSIETAHRGEEVQRGLKLFETNLHRWMNRDRPGSHGTIFNWKDD